MITEDEVVNQAKRIFEVLDSGKAQAGSFFDIITIMAFLHFSENKVDYGVVECGIGGKLDSTNIMSNASKTPVCAITSIGTDHTDKLGNTLQEIALQKAGIMKHG
jgi:dihydrofolate synthase / folylpolyglutamate synthase